MKHSGSAAASSLPWSRCVLAELRKPLQLRHFEKFSETCPYFSQCVWEHISKTLNSFQSQRLVHIFPTSSWKNQFPNPEIGLVPENLGNTSRYPLVNQCESPCSLSEIPGYSYNLYCIFFDISSLKIVKADHLHEYLRKRLPTQSFSKPII